MDPTSSTLEDARLRYTRIFPPGTDFSCVPFYRTITVIHGLFKRCWWHHRVEWGEYEPPTEGFIPVAQAMVQLAQFEYRREPPSKVPRWFLRFTLHSLSRDPLPPASVVADPLSIIAIDLECDISNVIAVTTLNQRWAYINQMTITLTHNQCTGGTNFESDNRETLDPGRSRRL
jgi:hypothetical protein